jgi:hypothetical protein
MPDQNVKDLLHCTVLYCICKTNMRKEMCIFNTNIYVRNFLSALSAELCRFFSFFSFSCRKKKYDATTAIGTFRLFFKMSKYQDPKFEGKGGEDAIATIVDMQGMRNKNPSLLIVCLFQYL